MQALLFYNKDVLSLFQRFGIHAFNIAVDGIKYDVCGKFSPEKRTADTLYAPELRCIDFELLVYALLTIKSYFDFPGHVYVESDIFFRFLFVVCRSYKFRNKMFIGYANIIRYAGEVVFIYHS